MHDMTRNIWSRGRLTALAGIAALSLGLAACGGSDSSLKDTTVASADQSGEAANSGVAEATKNIESLYAGESFAEPPSKGPKPVAGKNAWVVVTGLAFAGSALFADGTKAAAKEAG